MGVGIRTNHGLGIRIEKMSSVARLISSSSRHVGSQYSLEVLPRVGHRSHAHAVHPVPLDVFVEQLALLGLGQAAAEVLGGLDDQHEERGVRPVEGVGVEGVVAPAVAVDALDRLVVALICAPVSAARLPSYTTPMIGYTDRATRCSGSRSRIEWSSTPAPSSRIHVLDRADPHAQHPGAQVAEVLPGQGVGAEGIGGGACPRGRLRSRGHGVLADFQAGGVRPR